MDPGLLPLSWRSWKLRALPTAPPSSCHNKGPLTPPPPPASQSPQQVGEDSAVNRQAGRGLQGHCAGRPCLQ